MAQLPALTLLFFLTAALITAGDVAAKQPSVMACLKAPAKTGASLPAVTYSDMHGLWGGMTLTLEANGRYLRVQSEPGRRPQRVSTRVEPARHRQLVDLLIELSIWEQRVPERIAVPDESTASLRVRCGDAEVEIWEWYNELGKYRRISQVRDALLAFEPVP